MIRLETETRKIQAHLGGAVTTTALDVIVCFSDESLRDGRQFPTPVKLSTLPGSTAVDICDPPGAAVTREVDFISIRNMDTVNATVTVRYYDSDGTTKNIISVTLATIEHLDFSRGEWSVMDASGNRRQ